MLESLHATDLSHTGLPGANHRAAQRARARPRGARRTVDARCGGERAEAAPGQTLPEAVQTLVTVTQLYPTQLYEVGSEERAEQMRTVAAQVSDQLRRCGIADQADRLRRTADAAA